MSSRSNIFLAVCLIAPGLLSAQNAQLTQRADTTTANQLMQIERDIGTANVARDKSYFQRIEADEFVFTGSDGSVTTKQQDVASFNDPPGDWQLVEYSPHDMTVYRYGETAVVFGRTVSRLKHAQSGEERTRQSRFTDVFVRNKGQWQIVAGHGSTIRSQ